ncbi:MAG TPA: ABC transporter ATP-binding protein [Ktedonobacteraceae bacterium]|nr:ABC transporter ATP-binding protein [Ktedonobacteraceae bacterium]
MTMARISTPACAERAAAIEIEALSKEYQQKKTVVPAVKGLNLTVPAGQIFGFLGANGAGKTTTIKMICGLITPTTGSVRVNGYDVLRERGMAMRQIGAVLEGTRNIYWRLSAWENLMYFGRLKGCARRERQERARQLLQELDLWERRNDPVRLFSRGMQQKVAIACALIADPPIVLLDEPTLGLDVQAARTVKEWISMLANERGKTVILTTHQLDMAQALCHRVAIMRKGDLLTDQPLTALLHLFQQEHYQIKIGDLLTEPYPGWCDGFRIEVEDGVTTLSGAIEDQRAVADLLAQLNSLHLSLLSIERVAPSLENVFIRLLEEQKEEQHEKHLVSNLQ